MNDMYKTEINKSNRTKRQMRINVEFTEYKVQFFESSYRLNTLQKDGRFNFYFKLFSTKTKIKLNEQS